MALETIKGKTSSGFEFEIAKDRLNNYEMIEAFSELETNGLVLPRVAKMLLGDDLERLKDHLRNEDGVVPADVMIGQIVEILKSNGDLKK